MAGAPVAEFALRLRATDDASDVVAQVNAKIDAFAAKGVAATKRAQDQITAIIARGDPAKAAQLAAQRELETVQRLARQKPILAQQAADAEIAIRRRLAAELARIDQSSSASSAAASLSLQQRAKASAETVGKVASLANAATSALGGMGTAAGSAATAIVGAFGAGGPVAIAIAGSAAAIGLVVTRWVQLRERIRESQEQLDETRRDFIRAGEAGEREAAARLAALDAKPGDESAAAAAGFGESASGRAAAASAARAKSAQVSAELARVQAELDREREAATDLDGRRGPRGASGRVAVLSAAVDRLRAEDAALRAEATAAEAAASSNARAAAAYTRLSEAERKRASAKGATAGGRASAAAEARYEGPGGQSGTAALDRFVQGAGDFLPMGQGAADGAARASSLTPAEIEAEYARRYEAEARARAEANAKAAADAERLRQEQIIGIMGDVTAYANAGASAMQAFIEGMESERPEERVKGILTGVLTVAGAIVGGVLAGPAGILAGASAGSALAGVAGSFEDGGAPFAIGRRGLGTMPGGADGIPSILHPGEFVFSAPAVRAMGGIGAAAQAHEELRDGRGGSRSGSTTINVVALDPQTAVGVIERSVEPAQTQRLAARAGALHRAEIQRAARGIESGV